MAETDPSDYVTLLNNLLVKGGKLKAMPNIVLQKGYSKDKTVSLWLGRCEFGGKSFTAKGGSQKGVKGDICKNIYQWFQGQGEGPSFSLPLRDINYIEELNRVLEQHGKPLPVPSFLSRSNNDEQWQVVCKYDGQEYEAKGKNKKEAKQELFKAMYEVVELELGREQSKDLSPALAPSLNLRPNNRGRRKRKPDSVKRKAMKTKRFKEKLMKLKVGVWKVCRICRTDPSSTVGLNFQSYTTCSYCHNSLDEIADQTFIFGDVERTGGHMTDPPLSIGFAVYRGSTMISSKHIYILPDGDHPKVGGYCERHIHHMGVGYRGGKKVLLYDRKEILPTVSAKEASEEMVKYLQHVGGGDVDLYFHGEDHKTIKEFVKSQGCEEKFMKTVGRMINTQVFFKLVQGEKKFGMKTLVEEWGTEADRNVYKKAHSAEVDAIVLGSLCTGEALLRRFIDWASLCDEASGPVVYTLPSSQLTMHYIWQDSSILRGDSNNELFYCEV